ncbi:MAG: HAD family phosphatase [Halobacteriovoraceae bacterium]|jgi:HAD superfamily hydrolase (TIGR01484 family)|nr:HAD family phosphatase [Halobacteriovoraceae bacterium]
MKIIFSDFDGTLTNNGKLGAVFFDLLNLIDKNKSELVIVSGRSLSWGHFFLTHFPLKHVIMEGGGVIVGKNKEGHLYEENLISDQEIKKLDDLTNELVKLYPKCILSADSFGRRTDRAIEFSQMERSDVEAVELFLHKNGLNFSRSNVHINFWVGDISKARGVEYFIKNYAPHVGKDECLFYGDAANDESMFEFFPNTVGVSNILAILDQLEYKPKIILEGKDNSGALGVYNHLREFFDQSKNF